MQAEQILPTRHSGNLSGRRRRVRNAS